MVKILRPTTRSRYICFYIKISLTILVGLLFVTRLNYMLDMSTPQSSIPSTFSEQFNEHSFQNLFVNYFTKYYYRHCNSKEALDIHLCQIWKPVAGNLEAEFILTSKMVEGKHKYFESTFKRIFSSPEKICSLAESNHSLEDYSRNCKLFIYKPKMNTISLSGIFSFFDHLLQVSKAFYHQSPPGKILAMHIPLDSLNLSSDEVLIFHHLLVTHLIKNRIFPFLDSTLDYLLPSSDNYKVEAETDSFTFHPNPELFSFNGSLHETCSLLLNTRKHRSACFPEFSTPILRTFPVLITGLGGAGTHFLTKELQNLGFDLAHEDISSQGSVVSSRTIPVVLLLLNYPS
jgi:hypothetical protein